MLIGKPSGHNFNRHLFVNSNSRTESATVYRMSVGEKSSAINSRLVSGLSVTVSNGVASFSRPCDYGFIMAGDVFSVGESQFTLNSRINEYQWTIHRETEDTIGGMITDISTSFANPNDFFEFVSNSDMKAVLEMTISSNVEIDVSKLSTTPVSISTQFDKEVCGSNIGIGDNLPVVSIINASKDLENFHLKGCIVKLSTDTTLGSGGVISNCIVNLNNRSLILSDDSYMVFSTVANGNGVIISSNYTESHIVNCTLSELDFGFNVSDEAKYNVYGCMAVNCTAATIGTNTSGIHSFISDGIDIDSDYNFTINNNRDVINSDDVHYDSYLSKYSNFATISNSRYAISKGPIGYGSNVNRIPYKYIASADVDPVDISEIVGEIKGGKALLNDQRIYKLLREGMAVTINGTEAVVYSCSSTEADIAVNSGSKFCMDDCIITSIKTSSDSNVPQLVSGPAEILIHDHCSYLQVNASPESYSEIRIFGVGRNSVYGVESESNSNTRIVIENVNFINTGLISFGSGDMVIEKCLFVNCSLGIMSVSTAMIRNNKFIRCEECINIGSSNDSNIIGNVFYKCIDGITCSKEVRRSGDIKHIINSNIFTETETAFESKWKSGQTMMFNKFYRTDCYGLSPINIQNKVEFRNPDISETLSFMPSAVVDIKTPHFADMIKQGLSPTIEFVSSDSNLHGLVSQFGIDVVSVGAGVVNQDGTAEKYSLDMLNTPCVIFDGVMLIDVKDSYDNTASIGTGNLINTKMLETGVIGPGDYAIISDEAGVITNHKILEASNNGLYIIDCDMTGEFSLVSIDKAYATAQDAANFFATTSNDSIARLVPVSGKDFKGIVVDFNTDDRIIMFSSDVGEIERYSGSFEDGQIYTMSDLIGNNISVKSKNTVINGINFECTGNPDHMYSVEVESSHVVISNIKVKHTNKSGGSFRVFSPSGTKYSYMSNCASISAGVAIYAIGAVVENATVKGAVVAFTGHSSSIRDSILLGDISKSVMATYVSNCLFGTVNQNVLMPNYGCFNVPYNFLGDDSKSLSMKTNEYIAANRASFSGVSKCFSPWNKSIGSVQCDVTQKTIYGSIDSGIVNTNVTGVKCSVSNGVLTLNSMIHISTGVIITVESNEVFYRYAIAECHEGDPLSWKIVSAFSGDAVTDKFYDASVEYLSSSIEADAGDVDYQIVKPLYDGEYVPYNLKAANIKVVLSIVSERGGVDGVVLIKTIDSKISLNKIKSESITISSMNDPEYSTALHSSQSIDTITIPSGIEIATDNVKLVGLSTSSINTIGLDTKVIYSRVSNSTGFPLSDNSSCGMFVENSFSGSFSFDKEVEEEHFIIDIRKSSMQEGFTIRSDDWVDIIKYKNGSMIMLGKEILIGGLNNVMISNSSYHNGEFLDSSYNKIVIYTMDSGEPVKINEMKYNYQKLTVYGSAKSVRSISSVYKASKLLLSTSGLSLNRCHITSFSKIGEKLSKASIMGCSINTKDDSTASFSDSNVKGCYISSAENSHKIDGNFYAVKVYDTAESTYDKTCGPLYNYNVMSISGESLPLDIERYPMNFFSSYGCRLGTGVSYYPKTDDVTNEVSSYSFNKLSGIGRVFCKSKLLMSGMVMTNSMNEFTAILLYTPTKNVWVAKAISNVDQKSLGEVVFRGNSVTSYADSLIGSYNSSTDIGTPGDVFPSTVTHIKAGYPTNTETSFMINDDIYSKPKILSSKVSQIFGNRSMVMLHSVCAENGVVADLDCESTAVYGCLIKNTENKSALTIDGSKNVFIANNVVVSSNTGIFLKSGESVTIIHNTIDSEKSCVVTTPVIDGRIISKNNIFINKIGESFSNFNGESSPGSCGMERRSVLKSNTSEGALGWVIQNGNVDYYSHKFMGQYSPDFSFNKDSLNNAEPRLSRFDIGSRVRCEYMCDIGAVEVSVRGCDWGSGHSIVIDSNYSGGSNTSIIPEHVVYLRREEDRIPSIPIQFQFSSIESIVEYISNSVTPIFSVKVFVQPSKLPSTFYNEDAIFSGSFDFSNGNKSNISIDCISFDTIVDERQYGACRFRPASDFIVTSNDIGMKVNLRNTILDMSENSNYEIVKNI